MKKIRLMRKHTLRSITSLSMLVCLLIGISMPLFGGVVSYSVYEGSQIPVSIAKTVNGQPITDWWLDTRGAAGFDEFAQGLNYKIYSARYDFIREEFIVIDFEGDAHDEVTLNESGKIAFHVPEPGWYAIVENLSGSAGRSLTDNPALIIYVGPDGVMGALGKSNTDGTFTTQHLGGYSRGLKLIYTASEIPKEVYPPSSYPERYTNGVDGGEFYITGTKPDGSGQAFTSEKFAVTLPDGTKGLSFCADLGAHFIYGNYVFDSSNHNFTDDQLYFIIAAFDYLHDLLGLTSRPNDPLYHDGFIEGKALAQVLLWNMILEIDKVDRGGKLTKNAGYADMWWEYLGFPSYVEVDRIEGTVDWYYRTFIDYHNSGGRLSNFPELAADGIVSYSDLINDMLNDLESGRKYIDIYEAKIGTAKEPDVSGVVFITASANSGFDPIDQQRQLMVLFGGAGVTLDSSLYYDVALRKWVSSVERSAPGDVYSKPAVNTDVPNVSVGDKVTFTIEVYNQTDNPTWVSRLVDYMPAGYAFNPAENTDWVADKAPETGGANAGMVLGPATLTYTGPAFRLKDSDAAWDVAIVLKVLPNADGTVLRNAAEVLKINEDKDSSGVEPGEEVEDIDSTFSEEERRRWDPRKEKDNEIWEDGKKGGDKDDYDFAEVIISNKIDIKVTKIWDDNSNVFGLRPPSITVHLKKNGLTVETRTLTGAGNVGEWSLTFHNLTDDGVYTVEEEAVAGYAAAPPGGNVTSGFTITNTVISPSVGIDVEKVWNDGGVPGSRPASVTINLLRDGIKVNSHVLSSPWVGFTFYTDSSSDPLPKFDLTGREYVYTVSEDPAPNYVSAITGSASGGYTVTNTLTIGIPITKIWDDSSNRYNARPGSVTIDLLRDNMIVKTETVTGTGDTWTHEFTGLPKYRPDGLSEYEYTVRERQVDSYNTTVDGFNITNKLNAAEFVISIRVQKIWKTGGVAEGEATIPQKVAVDLYGDGAYIKSTDLLKSEGWEGWFNGLDPDLVYTLKEHSDNWTAWYEFEIEVTGIDDERKAYATITNTWVPPPITVTGVKEWVDDVNADRTRPTSVEVILNRNGSEFRRQTVTGTGTGTTWSYSFTGLPAYDTSGPVYVPYVYTVDEVEPSGYKKSVSGTTITNRLLPGTVTVNGRKTWNLGGWTGADVPTQADIDDNAKIIIELLRSVPGQDAVAVNTREVRAPWTYTFNADEEGEPLPKYDADGRKYVYTVKEGVISGLDGDVAFKSLVTGMDITNTLDIEYVKTDFEITKVWVDNNNNNGTRPGTITLILYQNGVPTSYAPQIADNGDSTWTCVFTDLPKYNPATFRENVYMVDEVVPVGYTKNISGDGLTITNTLAPGVTSISVEKIWLDGTDLSMRPETLDVRLLRSVDGGAAWEDSLNTVTLSRYGWSHTWSDLPKYSEDQKLYDYKVEEIIASAKRLVGDALVSYDLTDYYEEPIYTGNAASGYKITNTRTGLIISGKKTWDDGNNSANTRPNIITVELLRNGEPFQTLRVGAPRWEWTFVDLPDAPEYEYTIKEVAMPDNYESEIIGYDITNTLIKSPAAVSLQAQKVVAGSNAPPLSAGQFWFGVFDSARNEIRRAANRADGSIEFGEIHLSAAGVYEFTIQEMSVSSASWRTDNSVHGVIITVTENATGFSASILYEGVDPPVFTNTYISGQVVSQDEPDGPPPNQPPPPVVTSLPTEEPPRSDEPTPEEQETPYVPGGNDRETPPRPSIIGNRVVLSDDGILIEIDEFDVPLGEWWWDDEEEMWIFDEYVPLAFMPQTGIAGAQSLLIALFELFTLTGVCGVLLHGVRKYRRLG